MKTSFPRLLTALALVSTLTAPLQSLRAQGLSASSLRSTTPSEIDRDAGRVQAIIDQAEGHYKLGELSLKDRNIDAARTEFDKSVDAVLESGMDVRSNPKLQTYYLQLVERIYRMEVPAQQSSQQVVVAANATNDVQRQEKLEKQSPAATAASTTHTCLGVKADSLMLRGLHLGMPVSEVKKLIPGIPVSAVDKYGQASSFAMVVPDRALALRQPYVGVRTVYSGYSLKGVRSVYVTYMDGRVNHIALSYENSVKWESADEFVSQVAVSLGLPGDWSSYARGESGPQLRQLRCPDFVILAGLSSSAIHAPEPEITLFSTVSLGVLNEACARRGR
jgi:hypothetical protein